MTSQCNVRYTISVRRDECGHLNVIEVLANDVGRAMCEALEAQPRVQKDPWLIEKVFVTKSGECLYDAGNPQYQTVKPPHVARLVRSYPNPIEHRGGAGVAALAAGYGASAKTITKMYKFSYLFAPEQFSRIINESSVEDAITHVAQMNDSWPTDDMRRFVLFKCMELGKFEAVLRWLIINNWINPHEA